VRHRTHEEEDMIAKALSKWIGCVSCILVVALTWPSLGQELPTAKPEEVGVSSEKVEELSTFMQSLVDDGKIAGGVTMMARHGKVIHLEAVGMADRETKKPMQTDSIFRIASMTKPIASVAVMRLCDQGKLDLDAPVSKYIPEFKEPEVLVSVEPLETRPAKREITIRHLLTHTSGLGYNSTDRVGPIYARNGIVLGVCSTDVTLEGMVKRLAGLPLQFDPGTQWQYGMSTDVLGRVVEVVSGNTFDKFISEEVCVPLGMMDTFFTAPPEKRHRLVSAYVPVEGGIRKLPEGERLDYRVSLISSDYHLERNKCFSGGAGLSSTAADYMRFCQMLLNGGVLNGKRLLREDTVKMMSMNQTDDLREAEGFGLGFGIKPDNEDVHEQLRSSYSWGGFWSTSFRISPRGDWIVVTMSQVAWDFELTPKTLEHYEEIAAEAIQD
jgi:CubicO group peptidase (beta-lactamase class C family)